MGAGSPYCDLGEEILTTHFTNIYSARDGSVGAPPDPASLIPPSVAPPPLLEPVLPTEIEALLKRTANTAPGPDKVTYANWRQKDPTGHVLAAIFNICLRARKFPPNWKKSVTVLIHKKGPMDDVTNWRPIALSDTAGKLLCSVLAGRLGAWASRHGILSWAQKGFTPAEGCLEHNFILQEALDDARRRSREVCAAWLDLSNAFGSVPHASLLAALRQAGLNHDQLELVADLYSDSFTAVRHKNGVTPDIPFLAGVRQGCPLSPILFNITMESLLRVVTSRSERYGYPLRGSHVSLLAYADDVVLVASCPESLQSQLNLINQAAGWVGLSFKPSKCATLHMSRKKVLPTAFHIEGQALAILHDGEHYQHLGVPTGIHVDQTPRHTIDRLEQEARKIFDSLLAPWQKLQAIRTFITPQLDFHLRTARVQKTAFHGLDKVLKKGAKDTLHLPQRASAEVVFIPPSWGGAGLLPLADQADLCALNHAFRLLTSPDPVVKEAALSGLTAAVKRRIPDPSRADLTEFLSGSLEGPLARDGGDIGTIWSAARNACRRLRSRLPALRWGWSEERDSFQVTAPDRNDTTCIVDAEARGNLARVLRNAAQLAYLQRLTAKKDQGKIFRATGQVATANHFLSAGKYTRFADWRFIHRARLGVLPLNGCKRWQSGSNNRRCRRCGQHDETTAHVPCHCAPHLATMQRRHDAILDRLTGAIKTRGSEELRVNKTVPFGDLTPPEIASSVDPSLRALRPDLLLIDRSNRVAHIVDVTVPFEDGWGALHQARDAKLHKYQPIADILTAAGLATTVEAFVVGSLGAWFPNNVRALRALKISRRYGQTMAKLCVSDTIKWSRDIYIEHLTGQRQY